MHNGYWHDGMGDGNWGWIAMIIMMIVFWGGLIWIGVTLLKRNHHTAQLQTPSPMPLTTPRPTPQEVLADRLARGEIEPDDYRQRLDALRHTTEG